MLSINRAGVAGLTLALMALGFSDRACFAARRTLFHRPQTARQFHHKPIVGRKFGNANPNPNLFATQWNNENLNNKVNYRRPWQMRNKNLPTLSGGQSTAIEHLNLENQR